MCKKWFGVPKRSRADEGSTNTKQIFQILQIYEIVGGEGRDDRPRSSVTRRHNRSTHGTRPRPLRAVRKFWDDRKRSPLHVANAPGGRVSPNPTRPYGNTAQTSTRRLFPVVSLFRTSAPPMPTAYMTFATPPLSRIVARTLSARSIDVFSLTFGSPFLSV